MPEYSLVRKERRSFSLRIQWTGEFRSCWGWSYKQVPLEHIFWLSFFASFSWTWLENFTFPTRPLYFLPIQTGFSGSCAPESATNPIGHSHLYDPTVLLQTWLAPQVSGDWHSSKSTKVKKQNCTVNEDNWTTTDQWDLSYDLHSLLRLYSLDCSERHFQVLPYLGMTNMCCVCFSFLNRHHLSSVFKITCVCHLWDECW